MKKTVILILLILPIVLMITISIAGRIISQYVHIGVDSIILVDEDDIEIANTTIILDINQTYQIKHKVLPELATYKDVTFSSTNSAICTVDNKGLLKGENYGTARVNIVSKDNRNVFLQLLVRITSNEISSVVINEGASIEVQVNKSMRLSYSIEPYTVQNKNVVWISEDDKIATVDIFGNITAHTLGTAFIKCVPTMLVPRDNNGTLLIDEINYSNIVYATIEVRVVEEGVFELIQVEEDSNTAVITNGTNLHNEEFLLIPESSHLQNNIEFIKYEIIGNSNYAKLIIEDNQQKIEFLGNYTNQRIYLKVMILSENGFREETRFYILRV